MEPMATNRQALIWLCVCPQSKNSIKLTKFFYIAFTMTIYIGFIFEFGGSVAFLFKYLDDLEKVLSASAPIFGWGGAIFSFSIAHIQWKKINNIFEQLKEIYEECKI